MISLERWNRSKTCPLSPTGRDRHVGINSKQRGHNEYEESFLLHRERERNQDRPDCIEELDHVPDLRGKDRPEGGHGEGEEADQKRPLCAREGLVHVRTGGQRCADHRKRKFMWVYKHIIMWKLVLTDCEFKKVLRKFEESRLIAIPKPTLPFSWWRRPTGRWKPGSCRRMSTNTIWCSTTTRRVRSTKCSLAINCKCGSFRKIQTY